MKRFRIWIMLDLFLLFGLINAVRAEYMVVGVESGDWAKYDINLADEPVNPITHDYWIKITVHNVTGTVISGMFEEKSASGIGPPLEFSLDISRSSSSYVIKDYYIIPANLTVGSVIPSLNLTVQGIYTSERTGREAIYTEKEGGSQQQGYWSVYYSWDRSTGLLLEYYPSGTRIEIMGTNLWGDQTDWTFWTLVIIVPVVVAIISIGLFVRHKRRLRRLSESYVDGPPPSKPEPPS